MIINEDIAMEVIFGFKEHEVWTPHCRRSHDFDVIRAPGKLTFMSFIRDVEREERITSIELLFGSQPEPWAEADFSRVLHMYPGDTLIVNYTIEWRHKGGGDGFFYGPPSGFPAGVRTFELPRPRVEDIIFSVPLAC